MKKKRLQYISLLLFFTYLLNLCVPCLPVQAEAISAPVSLTEDTSFSDIAGHWAEKGIKAWTTRQLAGGYPDGTFRPDSPITRAEFLTLVNRAFGYTAAGQASYCDVAETDWFAGEIAKAAAVGYLGGYPDGTVKPRNPITRQEAAALFAKILPPSETSVATETFEISATQNQTAQFADQAQIPAWSQAAIAAAVRGGYMSGYPDGTFQPTRPITRAEAISVLDRAVGTLYNHAGTYGSSQGTTLLEGNVTINTAGITLQNMTITGNIYLTEGIGEGDVTLDNVIIQGTTKISGGGSNSIHLLNTTVGAVLVNVPNRHLVRLLAQGSTAVGTLEARTPARLEEEGLTGSGFTKVVINTQQAITAPGSTTPQSSTITVELLGQFSDIEVQSATAQLNLQGGSIQNLTLTSTAQAAQINLAAWTSINTLTADTPATVQGQGTIEMLEANVDGVVVEASAKNVILEDGVQATVEGKTITENIVTETKKKKSKDAALSDLTIDGKTGKTTVPGFASDILSYEIILSEETKTAPTVAATAHYSKAKAEVTQATTLPGSATVLVIAENGATRKYIVNFVTATVCGIAVKSAPTKTCYIEGDCLDLTGLVVTLTRTDGSTEDVSFVNFDSKGISASPANGTELSPTNKEVIITHTVSGMSVGQAITVTVTSTYTVTYAGNGNTAGAVPSDSTEYEKGASVTVLGNTGNLVREDYTFAGWNTQANGEGTSYAEGATFAMGTANVTLYAQWTIKTYKVTYEGTNAGSGDVPLDGNVYEKGASVTVLGNTGNLVREDYTFAGWNTQANGEGTSYAAGAEFSITADTTLYAKWENVLVDSITVTGGEGITTDQGTLQMSAAVLPANATDKTVTWSVLTWADDGSVLTGDAIISETGVLTAVVNGTVKVVATAKDGSGVKGELEITISNQAVRSLYGVSWRTSGKDTSMTRLGTAKDKTAGTDFSDFYPWSEMKLCNVADDGKTIIYIGDKDEFGEELFKRDGTNGQVMVKIPKFYYKHTYNDTTGEHRFWATDGPAAGFALHPAFIRAGAEKDYVFIGAYEAWIDDNGKLASISGKPPTTNKKIADFRAAAQVRRTETNKGWNQLDVQTISAVQLLYLVENANTNCQTAIGKGVVDLGWTNGEYRAVVTGGCDDLGGASGMVDSGENGKKSVSYRGIENLWGNVWAFVDGININDHVPSVDGTVAGFTLSSDNGWVSNFAYSTAGDWLLMPGAVVSNESDSYVPDYYYQTPDERVALVGGYWNSGTIAGLFSWGVHRDSSNANLDVGGRVLLIP